MNLYRHKKSGGVYAVITGAFTEADKTHVVVYRRVGATSSDMNWVRPASEFYDGRFEMLTRQDIEAALADANAKQLSEVEQ